MSSSAIGQQRARKRGRPAIDDSGGFLDDDSGSKGDLRRPADGVQAQALLRALGCKHASKAARSITRKSQQELQELFRLTFGEPTHSNNNTYLRRRLLGVLGVPVLKYLDAVKPHGRRRARTCKKATTTPVAAAGNSVGEERGIRGCIAVAAAGSTSGAGVGSQGCTPVAAGSSGIGEGGSSRVCTAGVGPSVQTHTAQTNLQQLPAASRLPSPNWSSSSGPSIPPAIPRSQVQEWGCITPAVPPPSRATAGPSSSRGPGTALAPPQGLRSRRLAYTSSRNGTAAAVTAVAAAAAPVIAAVQHCSSGTTGTRGPNPFASYHPPAESLLLPGMFRAPAPAQLMSSPWVVSLDDALLQLGPAGTMWLPAAVEGQQAERCWEQKRSSSGAPKPQASQMLPYAWLSIPALTQGTMKGRSCLAVSSGLASCLKSLELALSGSWPVGWQPHKRAGSTPTANHSPQAAREAAESAPSSCEIATQKAPVAAAAAVDAPAAVAAAIAARHAQAAGPPAHKVAGGGQEDFAAFCSKWTAGDDDPLPLPLWPAYPLPSCSWLNPVC